MPGGDNTIALLSNITKKLDIITDTIIHTNDPDRQRRDAESSIINNRITQTGLNTAEPIKSVPTSNQTVQTIALSESPATNISIENVIKLLGSLPNVVKNILKLNNRELRRFEKTLYTISNSIIKFVSGSGGDIDKLSKDAAAKYNMVISAISSLGNSIKQIAAMAPIIPIFNLSLILLRPGIKTLEKIFSDLAKFKNVSKDTFAGIRAISQMMTGFGAVIVSVIAISIAIKTIGITPILEGVGAVIGVITAYSALSLAVLAVSSKITAATTGLKDITAFITGMIGITALTMVMGMVVQSHYNLLLAGFAAIGSVMLGYGVIATLVLGIGTYTKSVEKSGALRDIAVFMLGCTLVTALTIQVGKFVTNSEMNEIVAGFAALSGTMLLAAGFAALLSIIKAPVQQGTNALIPISVFMLSTVGVIGGLLLTVKLKDALGVSYEDLFATIGVWTSIIIGIGGLALLAGSVGPTVAQGIPALKMCTVLAGAGVLLLAGVVAISWFGQTALGDDWKIKSLGTISIMGLIVTEFGLLAAAAGLAGPVMLPGIAAMALVEGLALGSISVINRIINLQEIMDKSGIDERHIRNTVSTIKTIINDLVGMVSSLSLGNSTGPFGRLRDGISVIGKSSVLSVLMLNIASITKALNSIAQITTPDGRRIRPTRVVNGELVAGEPVDIVRSGQTIIAVVRDFANLITQAFTNIRNRDMSKATRAMKSIGTMLTPISDFAKMLSTFNTGKNGTLHTVTIQENGKVVTEPDINVSEVASTIAGTITVFASTLFSSENAQLWENITSGGGLFRKSKAEKSMGILGKVIEPITSFVDTVSNFNTDASGNITVTDESGKQKVINLSAVASTIANAITVFASNISNIDFTRSDTKSSKNLSKVLKNLIEPVDKFVNMIIPYTQTPAGSLPVFDENGKKINDIDITRAAANISNSATIFAKSITELQSGMIVDTSKISMSSSVMSKYINDLVNVTKNTNEKQLKSFATTITSDTKSLSDFDNVLNNGSKKRIENINSLANAIGSLTEKLAESQEGLSALAHMFADLNDLEPERIRRVINELGNIDKDTLRNAKGIGDAAGSTEADISEAIKSALGDITISIPDVTLRSVESYSSNHPNYNVDDITARFETR